MKMGKKADAKNKDEDEKIGENEFNFSILYIKLGYMAIFMKIRDDLCIYFFFEIFREKNILGQRCRNYIFIWSWCKNLAFR